MPTGIGISNRIIPNIREAVQILRIEHARNQRIRLDKAVNIRRTRISVGKKKVVNVQEHQIQDFRLQKRHMRMIFIVRVIADLPAAGSEGGPGLPMTIYEIADLRFRFHYFLKA
jgi:hypothetical protein